MCEGAMLHDPELFTEHLMKVFCELQSDLVVNVRLLVSECLQKTYTGKYETQTCLHEVVKRFKLDSSKDVRLPIINLKIPEPKAETVVLEEFVRSMLDEIYNKL